MRLVLGLIVASLVGADAPATSDAPDLTYDVKILDMTGLDWRSTFYPELQSVTHRGTATVWTAPKTAVARLAARAGNVISSPRLTSNAQARAAVLNSKSRPLVTEMTRCADGPVNHASLLAWMPKVEQASEGYSVNVSGRKLDQGVLAQVSIDDKQVTAVHEVTLNEATEKPGGKSQNYATKVQVPEYAAAQVAGEWLIPNDGVLVVSLGAHTLSDEKGKAVVRERLVLVEARPADRQVHAAAFDPASPMGMALKAIHSRPFPLATPSTPSGMPMPAPSVPSRSLPQGLTADGEPVALPPLPDELLHPPTSLPDSAEPCATPQIRHVPVGDPIPMDQSALRDTASRRTSFTDEPACCSADVNMPQGASAPKTFSARAFRFVLPGKANTVIEVHATARPVPSADAPPPPAIDDSKKD